MWALALIGDSAKPRLVLLPTGPGQPRPVPTGAVAVQVFGRGAVLFRDGNRVLVRGSEKGSNVRLYVLDLATGAIRPISPPVSPDAAMLVSPDGRRIVSSDDQGNSFLYDVDGGAPRPIPVLSKNLYPIRWCADGRSLFVRTAQIQPLKVHRFDLESGRLDPWREFSVTDIGSGRLDVLPTPDGKSYVYGYDRYFSDLFVAEGVR